VAELTLVEAINDCFHVELGRDENVMVMGEDVGRAGGVFRATAGLRDKFGSDRCVDTPLAEAGIIGSAIGLCMAGFRPVCEMQYDAFSYPALDQLITHVGRYRWRTGGQMTFPLTVRMPYGGGVRAPELHDDSPEAYYVHTPGVKVAIPSTPSDAKGLLAAAIRDPDPVVIFEPKLHYRTMRGEVPEGEHVVPLGQARTVREGDDVTLVAYGSMVPLAEQAADALADRASAEILDIRSLKPLDEDALLAAAAKTGRVVIIQEAPRTAGYGAELAAILAEKAMLDLRGPVLRVTGYDVPYPCHVSSGACTASSRRTCSSRSSRSTPATRCESRSRITPGTPLVTSIWSREARSTSRGTRSRARSSFAEHGRGRRSPFGSTRSSPRIGALRTAGLSTRSTGSSRTASAGRSGSSSTSHRSSA